MKYTNQPELAAATRVVDAEGDDSSYKDYIVGFTVYADTPAKSGGVLQLDFKNYRGDKNLLVEFCLDEIVAAISKATLNAER